MDTNEKTQKKPGIFSCEACDYKSHHKHDYTRHLLTLKHKILTKKPKKPKTINRINVRAVTHISSHQVFVTIRRVVGY